jgi:hypothetical protein
MITYLVIFVFGLLSCFEQSPEEDGPLQRIRGDYEKINQKYNEALRASDNEKQREELLGVKRTHIQECVRSALRLAEIHGADSVAFDSLKWIITGGPGYYPETGQALDKIQEHHLTNKKLGLLCVHVKVFRNVYPKTAEFLRSAMQRNPDLEVQGLACLTLAQVLQAYAGLAKKLKDPTSAKTIEEDWPKEIVEKLKRTDPEKMIREAEQLFQQTIEKYQEVKSPDDGTSLKLKAEACLFEMQRLRVGMVAPEILGIDIDGNKLRLGDYRGKVVVLEFWGHW